MTPHKMLNKHNPPHSYGDCFRTCVASLLDLHPSKVPNFFEGAETPETITAAWDAVDKYLVSKNLTKIVFAFDGSEPLDNALFALAGNAPNAYYILLGSSRNGEAHAVIGRNGKIEFDPSWTDIGIDGPTEHGYYIVMFFVPRQLTAH